MTPAIVRDLETLLREESFALDAQDLDYLQTHLLPRKGALVTALAKARAAHPEDAELAAHCRAIQAHQAENAARLQRLIEANRAEFHGLAHGVRRLFGVRRAYGRTVGRQRGGARHRTIASA